MVKNNKHKGRAQFTLEKNLFLQQNSFGSSVKQILCLSPAVEISAHFALRV